MRNKSERQLTEKRRADIQFLTGILRHFTWPGGWNTPKPKKRTDAKQKRS